MTLHRTCTAALGLCERKNELWLGLFFLFFCYSKTIRESKGMVKTKQIKTCRKKRHVRIDSMKEMPNLICGKGAVGGNYNSTRDNIVCYTGWKNHPDHS